MNKQKFLELMKTPERMSGADFETLERLTNENPYFQNGHSVLARASRALKIKSSPKKLGTAAIYATSRNRFKQYIQGQIKFARQVNPPTKKPPSPPTKVQAAPLRQKVQRPLPDDEQSQLVKEVYANLAKWKASRDEYLEYDRNHPEDIIIEKLENDTPPIALEAIKEETIEPEVSTPVVEEKKEIDPVQQLKDQVAEEIEAEEKTISDAISDITQPTTEESPSEPSNKKEEIDNSQPTSVDEIEEEEEEEEEEEIPKVESIPKAEEIESQETEAVMEIAEDVIEDSAVEEKTEIKASNETNSAVDVPGKENLEVSSDELSAIVDAIANGDEEVEAPKAQTPPSEKEDSIAEIEKLLEQRASEEASEVTEAKENVVVSEESIPSETEEIEDSKADEATKIVQEEVDPQSLIDDSPTIETEGEEAIEPDEEEIDSVESSEQIAISEEAEIHLDLEIDSDKSTEETEDELHKIEEEIHELKLDLNTSKKKKTWRLGMLKYGTQFTKPRAKKKEFIEKSVKKSSKAKKAIPKEGEKKKVVKKVAPKLKASTTTKAKEAKSGKKTEVEPEAESQKKKPKKKIIPKADKEIKSQKSIIDSFIAVNPSIVISKDKHQDSDPIEDLGMGSEAFPDKLVTENLASILTKQGKISKAIELYEKLILKNPQKKSYFASQIENLKKK